jgi:secondary thiamine-phosphate synthase enzyme
LVYQKDVTVATRGHGDMLDITEALREAVRQSGIRAGIAHVFNVGSTASVGLIEFEPGLARDLPVALDRLFPPGLDYAHEQAWQDGNGHSHVQATMLGSSATVPVRGGEPVLGAWQQVFLAECDVHSRTRTLVITVMGE